MIEQFDRTVAPGEILTLMGPSGSGKSSLLALVAGVLPKSLSAGGTVLLGGRVLNGLPTADRKVGILFQDPLLFPHMSVGENLAFALPAHVRGRARSDAVDAALERGGLTGFAKRDPATLSGGQQSRVSVLRTLLAEPKALLLDEPFSRLDYALRESFRRYVGEVVRDAGLPTLLVTHDPDDAPAGGVVLHMTDLGPAARDGSRGPRGAG
ncbi:MAG: ATP-binding cassette domain-containing protein [Pseudomonadota bacterium]